MKQVQIQWPNGSNTQAVVGSDWLEAARQAGFSIPTGCRAASSQSDPTTAWVLEPLGHWICTCFIAEGATG